jgi:hypothetical protein
MEHVGPAPGGVTTARRAPDPGQEFSVEFTEADPSVALAETLAWAVPSGSDKVNDVEVEEPAGIETDDELIDEPPVCEREIAMLVPDVLVTTFWNWSMRRTCASMNRDLPPGTSELKAQENDTPPPEFVQLTAGYLVVPALPTLALAKLRAAGAPALMVSVCEADTTLEAETERVGEPASSSP